MKKFVILLLLTLLLLTGCNKKAEPDFNSSIDDPAIAEGDEGKEDVSSQLGFEFVETSKGVYLKWNDLSNGCFNIVYHVKITTKGQSGEINKFEIASQYPFIDFSNFLRDIDLTICFEIYRNNILLDYCYYTYNTNVIHFTTAPTPQIEKIENKIIYLQQNYCTQISEEVIFLVHIDYYDENKQATSNLDIKMKRIANMIDLTSYLNNQNATITVKILGDHDINKTYYHDSSPSDLINYIN